MKQIVRITNDRTSLYCPIPLQVRQKFTLKKGDYMVWIENENGEVILKTLAQELKDDGKAGIRRDGKNKG